MSVASMGRAVVLLATSCAAFRSSHSIAPSAMTRSQPRRIARALTPCGTTLQYRNGDEDQPIDMRIANAGAVAEHVVSRTSDANKGVSSRPTRRWLFPVLASSSATSDIDEEQLAMDEYLDYLGRRYNRLHQDEATASTSRPRVILDFRPPRKLFLSTLARDSPTSAPSMARCEDHHSDPLYILGLSGLASARLRPRLHEPCVVRDNDRHPLRTEPRTGNSLSNQSSPRPLQFQLIKTLQRIMANFASLRIIPGLLEKGGLTVASLAILFLFRPLLKGAFTQA